MIVLTPEEMRKTDQAAIEAGYPDLLLMEIAGRGVAEVVIDYLHDDHHHQNSILILAGKGNNGGDGLVAARYLDMWGYNVLVVLLAEEGELQGNPEKNNQLCKLRQIEMITHGNDLGDDELYAIINGADLIIDALLGTGVKGEVREPYNTIIELVNNSGKPVIAVDIPSGIDGETGKVLGRAITAEITATMAYPKVGLLLFPARDYTGFLKIIDLGIPDNITDRVGYNHFTMMGREARYWLPARSANSHKGTFGKVCILGGSRGITGAPALSGLAALKTGAGLVRVAVPENLLTVTSAYNKELITIGLKGFDDYSTTADLVQIEEVMNQADVLAVGPGMGQAEGVSGIVNKIIFEFEGKLVVDADGLNAIKELDVLKKRDKPIILTPHPGEMAHLLEKDIDYIEDNRIRVARDFATSYKVCLVLKGAATAVALPDGDIYINTTGNDGMASAGSGDVLTGIISGLLAQGLTAERAAVLGAYLHGLAGDLVLEKISSYSLTASDLIEYISKAILEIIKM